MSELVLGHLRGEGSPRRPSSQACRRSPRYPRAKRLRMSGYPPSRPRAPPQVRALMQARVRALAPPRAQPTSLSPLHSQPRLWPVPWLRPYAPFGVPPFASCARNLRQKLNHLRHPRSQRRGFQRQGVPSSDRRTQRQAPNCCRLHSSEPDSPCGSPQGSVGWRQPPVRVGGRHRGRCASHGPRAIHRGVRGRSTRM